MDRKRATQTPQHLDGIFDGLPTKVSYESLYTILTNKTLNTSKIQKKEELIKTLRGGFVKNIQAYMGLLKSEVLEEIKQHINEKMHENKEEIQSHEKQIQDLHREINGCKMHIKGEINECKSHIKNIEEKQSTSINDIQNTLVQDDYQPSIETRLHTCEQQVNEQLKLNKIYEESCQILALMFSHIMDSSHTIQDGIIEEYTHHNKWFNRYIPDDINVHQDEDDNEDEQPASHVITYDSITPSEAAYDLNVVPYDQKIVHQQTRHTFPRISPSNPQARKDDIRNPNSDRRREWV